MAETLASLCAIAPVLTLTNGKPTTTSLDIAQCFGKRHDHVMRDIRALLEQLSEEHQPNFGLMFFDVAIGNGAIRQHPAYRITRDGFTLLAMGFTGKKALQFKLAYLDAFNRMEAELSKPALPEPAGNLWEATRRMGGFAAAVGLQVQMKVLDMIAKGKTSAQVDASLQHHRWMVYFDHTGKALAKELPQDARVMRPADLGQLIAQTGLDAPLSAEEVVNIAWHASLRMQYEANDRKKCSDLEALRQQVRNLPPHELADIAADAWTSLMLCSPIPKHLAKNPAK